MINLYNCLVCQHAASPGQRRTLIAPLLGAILASATLGQATLIHEWNFDETTGTNLVDSVGSSDGAIIAQPGGGGHTLGGGAVRLAGGDWSTGDYISLPTDIFNGLTDTTIEIWAEPHSFPNWSRLIDMGDGAVDPTDNNFRLSWCVGGDGNAQRFGMRPYAASTSTLVTPVDQLYHYAIVWTASGGPGGQAEISWYRDGVYVTNQVVGSDSVTSLPLNVVWLGQSPFPADGTANASYHAMRIYDTALTEAEIILNSLKGPDMDGPDGVDGLVHRWSFAETSGTALADSVSGADGQIIVPGGGGGAHTLGGGSVRLFGGDKDTSDYIELPSGLLSGLTDVSVEAWATPHSAQNWSRLFDFGSGVAPEGTWFLSFVIGADINQQRFEAGANPAFWTLNSAVGTALDQEYHYVATWSATGGSGGGGRAAWYRDGLLIGEVDTGLTTLADVDDTVLWLGRSQWPDNTADADFNEFRMYDRALTPAEVNFNRLNGPDNVTIPPPVAVDDFMTLNPGAQALIPVRDNDTGAQGVPGTVTVVSNAVFGTTSVDSLGRILYTHDGGGSTTDEFAYTVQNSVGETSMPATVYLTIDPSLRLENTTITIPNEAPPVTYGVVDAFPGLFFEDALAIRTPPGRTNQIFVGERRGRISYVPDIGAATPVRQVMLDITGQTVFDDSPQGEMGLLGFDFHPDFESNGYVYVYYMAPGSPYIGRLSRFTVDPVNLTTVPGSEYPLFEVVDQVFNHNGGDVHFGPDGYLYIGTGDEGDQYNNRQNAQRIDKDLYSALLRIDVDKKPGNVLPTGSANTTTVYTDAGQPRYWIPVDNPFVGWTQPTYYGDPVNLSTLRTEIYALGFRHIWRFWIDDVTGEIWVGDVGQDRWEEVDLVVKGGNYGWKYFEGTHPALDLYPGQPNLANAPQGFNHAEPIYEYIHAGQGADPSYHGDSVTGGVVYRGANIPDLQGAYLFADFEFQNIWALRRTPTVTVERLTARLGIAAFGVDPSNGDVLMANYLENSIQRLVKSSVDDGTFPDKLSDTGIFADMNTLSVNPGIVHYEPRQRFWSDNAKKTRWFVVPDLTNTFDFAQDDPWTLPTGTKMIKHFDLELELGNPATEKRVETRILTKTDNGAVGISYKWNEAGTEAFLVPDEGDTFFVTVTNGGVATNQFYEIPSRAGCLACHTAAGGFGLTFNTRQMNHHYPLNGYAGNEIDTLQAAGYFSGPVPEGSSLPTHAQLDDLTASLESRVRTYLAVNCAQCHQAGGPGGGFWDGRPELTLEETGLINGILDKDGGNPANRLVVPGDKAHSVVWLRMQATNGFSRMPPIGSHVLDDEAIALVAEWIDTGLSNRFYEQFQISYFGSTNAPNSQPGDNWDLDRADNYYEFLTKTDPTVAGDEWTLRAAVSNGQVVVSYDEIPNVGVLVEELTWMGTSSWNDGFGWDSWAVPGNSVWFPAGGNEVNLIGPVAPTGTNQLFRARFVEP